MEGNTLMGDAKMDMFSSWKKRILGKGGLIRGKRQRAKSRAGR